MGHANVIRDLRHDALSEVVTGFVNTLLAERRMEQQLINMPFLIEISEPRLNFHVREKG